MNEISENENKWYTVQELAELCGFDVATVNYPLPEGRGL